jgi:SAM-dependent methyltransferase
MSAYPSEKILAFLPAYQVGDPFAPIAPFYDQLMASVPYGEWADYVEQVMRHISFQPKDILDVACGTGTMALLLAARGYNLVGTDRSEAMLKVARKKAKQAGLDIPFYAQDAAHLDLPQKFDLAICLYDSFNYLLNEKDLLAAFRAIRRHLRPGGYLLFDINTLYAFHAELFTQENTPESEISYKWTSFFDPDSCICRVDMEFHPTPRKTIRAVHFQRAYLAEEIIKLLSRARFQPQRLFEAYTLLPPGRLSERVFYLAQKPASVKQKPQD